MRGLSRRAIAVVGLAAASVALTIPSWASGSGASIDHAQVRKGEVKLLVSVPGTQPVDLSSVAVTIDGTGTKSTAESASSAGDISRTTMLVIDTSRSMAGARITEAKKAADAYLAQVPANVKVGIVTFDRSVRNRLKPTLDRGAARKVISGLTLSLQTSLYAGVTDAVSALGTGGQRQILLLSDGKDTTHSSIATPISALKASKVKLDVVSLQQSDSGNRSLNQMAQASGGQVINAQDPKALSTAFTSEADVLARQVLVTVTVPHSQKAGSASVEVSLTSGGATYSDSAYVRVLPQAASPSPKQTPLPPVPVQPAVIAIPRAAMLGGVAAIGLGLLGVIVALFRSSRPANRPTSLAEQIGVYGPESKKPGKRSGAQSSTGSGALTDQARHAAESLLAGNRGLEARIAKRLDGAGVAMRPAEWLLMHVGIVLVCALIGILFFASSPILLIVLVPLGLLGPWLWLVVKKTRRLAAFGAGLADNLQLMSGSLSAGLSLAQSVDTIVRQGVEPIASEYRRVIVESRLGVPLEDALEGVADRMQSRDFTWVVMAIRIQREVGGNLAELLLTVAATLREREYLRRHVKALSAEGRLSCWILGGLPPGFLLYLTLSKPDYVSVLYTTPIGWVMLGAMAVMITVGVFWMSKVAKVEL